MGLKFLGKVQQVFTKKNLLSMKLQRVSYEPEQLDPQAGHRGVSADGKPHAVGFPALHSAVNILIFLWQATPKHQLYMSR